MIRSGRGSPDSGVESARHVASTSSTGCSASVFKNGSTLTGPVYPASRSPVMNPVRSITPVDAGRRR